MAFNKIKQILHEHKSANIEIKMNKGLSNLEDFKFLSGLGWYNAKRGLSLTY